MIVSNTIYTADMDIGDIVVLISDIVVLQRASYGIIAPIIDPIRWEYRRTFLAIDDDIGKLTRCTSDR